MTNVESRAVFSNAMTVMDKIHGPTRKNGGVQFCGMHVDLHQGAYRVAKAHSRNAGVPEAKKCYPSCSELTGVCAGTFDDHGWVSESTIAEQGGEVMGRDLDYEICIPCVVQWSMLWFSAPTRLNQTLEGEDINIVKYHEVVNHGRSQEAISMPFGGSHTPRTCMLTTVTAVLQKTHR